MRIRSVYVRFYKSFNFDYLRKNHPAAKPNPWEMISDKWFPHVRIPLLPDATTVVGANESGKSQLLSAIAKGLQGDKLGRGDFCRYSDFFSVKKDEIRKPDFGFHFDGLSDDECNTVRSCCSLPSTHLVDDFLFFRDPSGCGNIFLSKGESYDSFPVGADKVKELEKRFPHVFEIESRIGLPDSVPFSFLLGETREVFPRAYRAAIQDLFIKHEADFASKETVAKAAEKLAKEFTGLANLKELGESDPKRADRRTKRYELAKQLLCKVAKIDLGAIRDLREALRQCDEGLVNGILQEMNRQLQNALNFPKWWVQDRDFKLLLSAREDDLVFTIRDRTQTEYSFQERSNGLKYFLSYYVQFLEHDPPNDRGEILLMDEPDAYLSSQGQQDLLKIFNSFAHPDDGKSPIQVVYVTHSPFLIDKNHGERIRVLEKGTDDEGTRVVRDVSKNHYEPLRSSFGVFVGETTFIGHCNIVVEGLADQILLVAATNLLRHRKAPRSAILDLNHVTIVPAGCASQIPYLVFLARGRDVEKPVVVALLDSDQGGNEAIPKLRKKGPWGPALLEKHCILQIGELLTSESPPELPTNRILRETEDLVPIEIACEAAKLYLREFIAATDAQIKAITVEAIETNWRQDLTLYDAMCELVKHSLGADAHIDKVGFARSVASLVADVVADRRTPLSPGAINRFSVNFGSLLAQLAARQRASEREGVEERITARVERAINNFLRDYPNGCKREDAAILFEDIESVLDDSKEGDQVRVGLQDLRRRFSLSQEIASPIAEYSDFVSGLTMVRYAPKNLTQDPVDEVQMTTGRQVANSSIAQPTLELNGNGEKTNSASSDDPSSSETAVV